MAEFDIAAILTADATSMVSGMKQAQAASQGLQSSLAPLNKGLISVGVGAGAMGLGLIKMAREAFSSAARVSEMRVAIDAIGNSTGLGADKINEAANAIRAQGIEMAAAQKIAVTYAQNNLDLAQAAKVARVGQDLAVISQKNSTDVAELLTRAIQTGSTILLKSAGISRMASEGYDAYARSLGKGVQDLSAVERQQAIVNLIMEEGAKVAGVYEAAMTEPGKVLRSFKRIIDDMNVAIGEALLKGLGPLIKNFYDLVKNISSAVREGGALAPVVEGIGIAFGRLLAPLTGIIRAMSDFVKKAPDVGGSAESIAKSIEKFAPIVAAAGTALATFAGKSLLGGLPVIGKFVAGFNPLLAGFAILVATSPRLREGVMSILDGFKPLIPAALELGHALAEMGAQMAESLASAMKALAPLIGGVLKVLSVVVLGLVKALTAFKPVLFAVTVLLAKNMVTSSLMASKSFGKMRESITKMTTPIKGFVENMRLIRWDAMYQGAGMMKSFGIMTAAGFKMATLAVKAFAVEMIAALAPLIIVYAAIKIFTAWSERTKQVEERTRGLTEALKEQYSVLKKDADALSEYVMSSDQMSETIAGTGEDGEKLTIALHALGREATDVLDIFIAIKKNQAGTFTQLAEEAGIATDVAKVLGQTVKEYERGDFERLLAQNLTMAGLAAEDVMTPALVRLGKQLEELDDQFEKTDVKTFVESQLDLFKAMGSEEAAMVEHVRQTIEASDAYKKAATEEEKYLIILNAVGKQYPLLVAEQRRRAEVEEEIARATSDSAVATQGLALRMDELKMLESETAFTTDQLAQAIFGLTQVELNNAGKSLVAMRKEMTSLNDTVRNGAGNFDVLQESAYNLADMITENATNMKNMGKSGKEIEMMMTNLVNNFKSAALQGGYTEDQINRLVQTLGLLTDTPTVIEIEADLAPIEEQLQSLLDVLMAIVMAGGDVSYEQFMLLDELGRQVQALNSEKVAVENGIKTWKEYAQTVNGAGGGSATNAIEGFRSSLRQLLDDALAQAQQKVADATRAFEDFKGMVKSSISSIFSYGNAFSKYKQSIQTVEDANRRVAEAQMSLNQAVMSGDWGAIISANYEYVDASKAANQAQKKQLSFMDALKKQAQEARKFARLVKQLRDLGLGEYGIQQILAMGAEAGSEAAKEIIAGGQEAVDQANKYYTDVTKSANQLGQTLATDFYQAGIDSANAMVNAIAQQIFLLQPEIDRLTADLAEQLRTQITATIDVILNPVQAPTGGTNSKKKGASSMSFGASSLGNMNYASSSSGDQNINITVKAGIGDPAEIGKQIVQSLQAFQRRSGAIKIKVAE